MKSRFQKLIISKWHSLRYGTFLCIHSQIVIASNEPNFTPHSMELYSHDFAHNVDARCNQILPNFRKAIETAPQNKSHGSKSVVAKICAIRTQIFLGHKVLRSGITKIYICMIIPIRWLKSISNRTVIEATHVDFFSYRTVMEARHRAVIEASQMDYFKQSLQVCKEIL